MGAGGVITRKIGDRAGELAFGNACRRQFFVHDAQHRIGVGIGTRALRIGLSRPEKGLQ